MAEHYKDNPYVVGWQTDNEINCQFPECHCESCQEAFREFLRERYHSDIVALNRAWGAAFWAQTYTDFEQIETPKPDKPTHPNPSQMLDYYRYISWSVTAFQHDQVEILRDFAARRTVAPAWFVTHNGLFRHIDYRGQFTHDLDFLGYDVYPFFNHNAATRPLTQAFNLDMARAWSGNFMVPEQQSGPGGQSQLLPRYPRAGRDAPHGLHLHRPRRRQPAVLPLAHRPFWRGRILVRRARPRLRPAPPLPGSRPAGRGAASG